MNKEKEIVIRKKHFLLKLEREIKKLEFQLNNLYLFNFEINTLRGLKIGLRFLQLIAPYVVTAGIMFGIFSLCGGTPIVRDEVKKKLERMKQIDSLGNIRYLEQYDNFDTSIGTITYLGEWKELQDGFFSREVKTYEIGEISEEIVLKIVNNLEITSLNEVFGEPILEQVESRNNLSLEEIQTGAYLEAILYFENEEEFIVVKESVKENVGLTILCFCLTILAEGVPWLFREDLSSFDFIRCVDNIIDNHPLINKDELVRELEIKKSNYRRLTR